MWNIYNWILLISRCVLTLFLSVFAFIFGKHLKWITFRYILFDVPKFLIQCSILSFISKIIKISCFKYLANGFSRKYISYHNFVFRITFNTCTELREILNFSYVTGKAYVDKWNHLRNLNASVNFFRLLLRRNE